MPPSTTMLVPLMYAASSDRRNRTTDAMSSGWARRPQRACARSGAPAPRAAASRGASRGVSTAPGQTELTRMPSGPSRRAGGPGQARAARPWRRSRPAGTDCPPSPRSTRCTRWPSRDWPRAATACSSLVTVAAARRLTSSTSSQVSSSMRVTGTPPPMPAEWTRPPMVPSSARDRLTAAFSVRRPGDVDLEPDGADAELVDAPPGHPPRRRAVAVPQRHGPADLGQRQRGGLADARPAAGDDHARVGGRGPARVGAPPHGTRGPAGARGRGRRARSWRAGRSGAAGSSAVRGRSPAVHWRHCRSPSGLGGPGRGRQRSWSVQIPDRCGQLDRSCYRAG